MNAALRILAWGLGSLVWGALCFMLGLYVTFPSEKALTRLSFEVAERSRDEYAFSADSLAPWGLGLKADHATLYRVKRGRKTKDMEQAPLERTPFLEFETLAVRASPLDFLLGNRGASFSADFHGGTASGVFSNSEKRTVLGLHMADIDLAQIPYESVEAALHLVGKLDVDVDLDLNTEDIKKSEGSLRIRFTGFGLAEGSEVGGIELPVVMFSEAGVEMDCKDGKLTVTKGDFVSPELNATLSGEILLNKRLPRSRNSLELSFTLPEKFDQLAQLSPDLKRARDTDGNYHANIGGSVFDWTFRLNRTGGKVRSLGAGGEDRAFSPGLERARGVDAELGGGAAGGEEMSDEERRKAREERIRERRERLRQRREEAAKRRGENPDGAEEIDAPKNGPEEGPDFGAEPSMPEPGPPPPEDEAPPPYTEDGEEQ